MRRINWRCPLLLLTACAVEPEPMPEGAADVAAEVDCTGAPTVTWANWGEGFFRNYCTGCHSSLNTESRYGAPPSVNLNEEAGALALAARIRVRVLESHDMPSGGGIPADELVLLERFLDCAAPR